MQLECPVCGARVSGVRTEFGSLVVPGRDECSRCGAVEWAEVTRDDDGGAATQTETEAGNESRAEATTEADAESGPRAEK